MRGFRFLTLLLLALLATTYAYIDKVEEGEDENEDGELDENDDTPRELGDRCGTRNPCAPGLDCVRAPILRRCFPVTCGKVAAKALADSGFDLQGYGKEIMDDAGVAMTSNMFRKFPSARLEVFNKEEEDFKSVARSIERNRPSAIDLYTAAFTNCTEESGNSRATSAGTTPFTGASWALGMLATYNGDMFWGQGTNDPVGVGYVNHCFGSVLGMDAAISGLFGLAFTGTLADLELGCKQMFPVGSFPPFSLQVGWINSIPPTFLMELTAGFSASAGLPGCTSCTTEALNTTIFG